MIQYTLRCDQGHSFDSWFKSSEAFDTLTASGHVSCAICGSHEVAKAMMSPRVTTARGTGTGKPAPGAPSPQTAPAARPGAQRMTMGADPEVQRAVEALRRRVEAQSDYVGDRFAREARAMHLGEAPERPIYGEATASEARGLVEDGVPVLPLPFMPSRKTN